MNLIYLILLALLGSVAGLIGGAIFLVKESWAKKLCGVAVPFAAGVLITVSLLDLFPEALEIKGDAVFPIVLFSFLAAYLFENLVIHLHHHEGGTHGHKKEGSASLVVVGDTIHNFIDGVAIGAAYLVNPTLALIIAFSTFLHETPHEVADFGVLMSLGWGRLKTFMANFFSAMATIPGALLVYFYAVNESLIGSLLAVSAGLFLYLGATDFLPEALEGKKPWRGVVSLVSGVLIIYFVTMFAHFK